MNILKKYFGPSTLVAAAFIGPGTLTVCTVAGASFGYSLLWVLLLSVVTTIVLQEMSARLGLVTQKGLGEAINSQIKHPLLKVVSIILVFTAIVIGNAAYEAGNIAGAVLGVEGAMGKNIPWAIIIGGVSFGILWIGKFKIIERVLVGLVMLMSFVFLVTAIVVKPDIGGILSGLFIPSVSTANQFSILALIGTTVVPYNLFLHASSVQQKWKNTDQLVDLRKENAVAISLGGLISMAIIITSAATLFGASSVKSMSDMASQLSPLLGNWSGYFLGAGLFCAGISSAITAPLAAAYTARGIFGWDNDDTKSWKFRVVWILILVLGTVFSVVGYKPIQVIQIAQVANGILLPIVVFFLVYLSNKRSLLGDFVNKRWQNSLAAIVIIMSIIISFRSFNSVFHFL